MKLLSFSSLLLGFAVAVSAQDGFRPKQIVHLREPVTLHISEMHDETPIGGVAMSPEKQNEELANLQKNAIENSGVGTDNEDDLLNEDSDNSAADASDVSDSEPDDALESDSAVTSADSLVLPEILYVDMSKAVMPTSNMKVTSPFGPRTYRIHKGLDIKVQVGDTIRAAFDGIVTRSRYERRGYGNYVAITHENNGITETVYAHLSKRLVAVGDEVNAGDVIGLGGNTGRSTGSHLHFETRIGDNTAVDPAQFFDFENQTYTLSTVPLSVEHAHADMEAMQKVIAEYKAHHHSRHHRYAKYHNIRSGETLGSIARSHGTTISKLCRLNGISQHSKLKPGHKLRCS